MIVQDGANNPLFFDTRSNTVGQSSYFTPIALSAVTTNDFIIPAVGSTVVIPDFGTAVTLGFTSLVNPGPDIITSVAVYWRNVIFPACDRSQIQSYGTYQVLNEHQHARGYVRESDVHSGGRRCGHRRQPDVDSSRHATAAGPDGRLWTWPQLVRVARWKAIRGVGHRWWVLRDSGNKRLSGCAVEHHGESFHRGRWKLHRARQRGGYSSHAVRGDIGSISWSRPAPSIHAKHRFLLPSSG